MTVQLRLLDTEAVLLDGRVNADAQAIVDGAKRRIAMIAKHPEVPPAIGGLVADIVHMGRTKGTIRVRIEHCYRCWACGKEAGMVRKSKRSKEEIRGSFDCIDYHTGHVIVRGHVTHGCCLACDEILRPVLAAELADVPVEIEKWGRERLGMPERWKCWPNLRCSKCGWTGILPQMVQRSYTLANGWSMDWAPGCPKCDAINRTWGTAEVAEIRDAFTMVPVGGVE